MTVTDRIYNHFCGCYDYYHKDIKPVEDVRDGMRKLIDGSPIDRDRLINDLADLIMEYVPSSEIHSTYSIYQLLTEYPNEVADMAKQFNVSRGLIMEVIFDYDDKITKQLAR